MRGLFHLGFTGLLTALRERVTLFWTLLFPVLLFVLLSFIFGQVGEQGALRLNVAFVNLDRGDGADFAMAVETLFERLSVEGEDGRPPVFTLHRPAPDEDARRFLEDEQRALAYGQRAAVVVVPEGFGREVGGALGRPGELAGKLHVHYSQGVPSSELAAGVIDQVLAELDRALLTQAGRFDDDLAVRTATRWAGSEGRDVRYVDFILPGVVLMAFFTTGLFGVPGAILYARDQRILRRYWVTPLSVPRYLAGFGLTILGMCVLQLTVLWPLGRFALGARVSFAAPWPALYLVLAALTFLAFGFLVASLAKTANAGQAIANIINMPMLFLSGVFFPVADLPSVLQAIVYANPLTYLVDGLRTSLGVGAGQFAPWLTLAVPLGWIGVSAVVTSRRLHWDVGR